MSGDTIDYKANKILIGTYKTETPLEIFDMKTMKPISNLDWYQRGRSKRENSKIYSARFFNKTSDHGVLAGSCERNEMRIFEAESQNRTSFLI